MHPIKHSAHIFTVQNFWTDQKCDRFIEKSEAIGYELAGIQTDYGQKVVRDVRNNQRVLFSDISLAREIWETLKPFAVTKLGNSVAIGLNEMFRFYKYEPGQEFRKHRDQSFIRNESEASYFTFMIYLNDDFEGGQTTFNQCVIKPTKGTALIFFHDLEHAGSPLIRGTKYVLRTDVMYRLEA